MKWNNKGKELEIIGEKFVPEMKVYIYGAGELGRTMFERLAFLNCVAGFIDNDKIKQDNGYCGKMVESVLEFAKRFHSDFGKHNIVIICVSSGNIPILMRQLQLLSRGMFCEGINLFSFQSFSSYHLPFFAMYSYNKLVVDQVNIATTLRCTLNCKNCIACVPFHKHKEDFSVDMLKKSIDAFFITVDYVLLLEIAGGEPLLYMNILELICYIGQNYRNQIDVLMITTNGTIVPSDELCNEAKKYDILFKIDDYSANVSSKVIKIPEIKEILDKNYCNYFISLAEKWFDTKLGKVDYSTLSEEELGNYFTACQYNCMQLHEEKLFNCGYALFTLWAGLSEVEDELAYQLGGSTVEDKMLLFEYSHRYSSKGYVDLCKKCAGDYAINSNQIAVAEQLKN